MQGGGAVVSVKLHPHRWWRYRGVMQRPTGRSSLPAPVVVAVVAVVLVAVGGGVACATALPFVAIGHVWLKEPRCSMSVDDQNACRGAGTPGRPLACSGVDRPEPTEAERLEQEERFRRGEAHCVCITPAMEEACRNAM
jgi:hypothetical protein